MGLDIVVRKVGLNRNNRVATIVAEKQPTAKETSGIFYLEPNNEALENRWNSLFAQQGSSLRPVFKTAVELIRKHHGSYLTRGEKVELPYNDIKAYKVKQSPSLTITFHHHGGDPICDAVTVKMITTAGTVFRFNIFAENAIPTFAQKAQEYLKQEEGTQPVPLALNR